MTDKDIKTLMKKHGKVKFGPDGKISGADVICSICGKKISTDDVSGVEVSVTKLKSAIFMHSKCVPDFWKHKIQWRGL